MPVLPRHEQLRVRVALTRVRQYEIARKVGISESHVSRILAGLKDDDDLLERIDLAITELAK